MTQEDKIIRKKQQKNEAQKRYYRKNREYYLNYQKTHLNKAQKLQKRIDLAKNMIKNNEFDHLIEVLDGKYDNN